MKGYGICKDIFLITEKMKDALNTDISSQIIGRGKPISVKKQFHLYFDIKILCFSWMS